MTYLSKQVDLSIPIILITRITETGKYGMLSWPGVQGLIRKPINSQKVLDAVAKIPVAEQWDSESLERTGTSNLA